MDLGIQESKDKSGDIFMDLGIQKIIRNEQSTFR